MKKDILFPQVEGVSLAVIRKLNELNVPEWYVYFMNKNDYELENVIISSRGYGEIDGEKRESSILRHAFGTIDAQSYVLIEPIDPSVFPLNNEYWVSYYVNNNIYDKRFTFVPDSIVEQNLVKINFLNMEGILHD
jgi:hypothetical protein